jgi:glyoxylase-like metal-dependent hydrolase (beta-lactamase superfamily II)
MIKGRERNKTFSAFDRLTEYTDCTYREKIMEGAMAVRQIVPGVYMVPLGVVNAFLIEGDDNLILIDTGVPGSAEKILQAVSELGKKPADIQHILVTHCHADHSGSLHALKQATGAPAYMHPADAALVSQGKAARPMRPAPGLINNLVFRLFISRAPTGIEAATVDHEVHDGDELPFASGLRAIHAPGHCAGQLAFFLPRHGGLLFVADAAGNMLRLGPSPIYEDYPQGKRSLQKLAALDFEVACFGHGRPILRGASKRFSDKWGVATVAPAADSRRA